jgi:hypothetical protein
MWFNWPTATQSRVGKLDLCLDQMIELNLPIQHYVRGTGKVLTIKHLSPS